MGVSVGMTVAVGVDEGVGDRVGLEVEVGEGVWLAETVADGKITEAVGVVAKGAPLQLTATNNMTIPTNNLGVIFLGLFDILVCED